MRGSNIWSICNSNDVDIMGPLDTPRSVRPRSNQYTQGWVSAQLDTYSDPEDSWVVTTLALTNIDFGATRTTRAYSV